MTQPPSQIPQPEAVGKIRFGLIDELRGAAILLMVLYHAAYDLVDILQVNIPIFSAWWMNLLRDLFAALFLFISGACCRLSRNNFRRGAICFGFGMAVTLATLLIMPEQLICFGVLHLLGLGMMLFPLARPLLDKIPPAAGLAVFLIAAVLLRELPFGSVGLPYTPLRLELPSWLYQSKWLFWLGFPDNSFASADYFPLLPWLLVMASGSFFGVYLKENRVPRLFYRTHLPWLACVGRHTLLIYLLHQPVLFVIFFLVQMFV